MVKRFLLSVYYNSNLYTKDFMDLFLSSFEKITNQIINEDISKTRLCDIAIESKSENIVFNEVDILLFINVSKDKSRKLQIILH